MPVTIIDERKKAESNRKVQAEIYLTLDQAGWDAYDIAFIPTRIVDEDSIGFLLCKKIKIELEKNRAKFEGGSPRSINCASALIYVNFGNNIKGILTTITDEHVIEEIIPILQEIGRIIGLPENNNFQVKLKDALY